MTRQPARGTPPHDADLELVRATLRGDPAAIRRFVDRLARVAGFLHSRNRQRGQLLDEHALLDLVQSVMTLVWKKRSDYEGRASLEGWACSIGLLELFNHERNQRRRGGGLELQESHLAGDGGNPEPDPFAREALREALERLPDRERDVIRLKHYEDLSFSEIGRRIDAPSSTAKSFYYRGMERLRQGLRTRFGEHLP